MGRSASEPLGDTENRALELLRGACHQWWVRSVAHSRWKFWKELKEAVRQTQPEYWRDVGESGARAVGHAVESPFWEWTNGSGIFFWRWPEEYQANLALGLAPQWIGVPPSSKSPQGQLGSREVQGQLLEKIEKLERRGYLSPGDFRSLLNYFAVPKGKTDIRTVFDGTKSGLNSSLFANWFPLPQVKSMLRCLKRDYYCADNDVGEQFYNFCLHPALRPYCAIDIRALQDANVLSRGVNAFEARDGSG
jgi:hypothetical protein